MAFTSGFGEVLEYDDISEDERVYNADGSRMASWWIGRSRSDRFDDDTVFEVGVWDTATKQSIERFTRVHKLSYHSDQERGKPVSAVKFASDGTTLMIVFDDGSEEPGRTPRPDLKRSGQKLDFGMLGKKPFDDLP